jgi:hypothetical protein
LERLEWGKWTQCPLLIKKQRKKYSEGKKKEKSYSGHHFVKVKKEITNIIVI